MITSSNPHHHRVREALKSFLLAEDRNADVEVSPLVELLQVALYATTGVQLDIHTDEPTVEACRDDVSQYVEPKAADLEKATRMAWGCGVLAAASPDAVADIQENRSEGLLCLSQEEIAEAEREGRLAFRTEVASVAEDLDRRGLSAREALREFEEQGVRFAHPEEHDLRTIALRELVKREDG